MTARRDPADRPAGGLLHPVVLLALAILVLNDQVLKAAWPGFVTGKLSDVPGLIIAPLALQAVWEVVAWASGRWHGPSQQSLAFAIVLVGVAFVAVQVWPPATDAYRWGLGAAQWPVRAIGNLLAGVPAGGIVPVSVTPDAEDLLALPVLGITWLVGRRRRAEPVASPVAAGPAARP